MTLESTANNKPLRRCELSQDKNIDDIKENSRLIIHAEDYHKISKNSFGRTMMDLMLDK